VRMSDCGPMTGPLSIWAEESMPEIVSAALALCSKVSQIGVSAGQMDAFLHRRMMKTATLGRAYPNNMPAYDGVLSDDEIIAVLSYIKSRWPAPVREQHDQINARANAG